jgi:hypothetical protein
MNGIKKETIVYKGLGFPIKLIDVPMKKMFGDWVIDIDMTELQLLVLMALVYKPIRLTKDELKFIRHFLVMTTTVFGKIFGVYPKRSQTWNLDRAKAPAVRRSQLTI